MKADDRKVYLGDGVYVVFDGYDLILTTENGIAVTNRIVLDPAVRFSLFQFIEQIRGAMEASTHES